MTRNQKKWALAAALGPVLALGLCLPFQPRSGGEALPVLEPSAALRQELEACIADEDNLLNRLVSDQQIAQAARRGQAAALRCAPGTPLAVGGYAQPVQPERLVLLASDGAYYAAVYAEGQQSVFALDEALARALFAQT